MQKKLRRLRKAQGLTLALVAASIDLDAGNLSRIERAKQLASLDVAERLARFYEGEITEMEILYPHRYSFEENKQQHAQG